MEDKREVSVEMSGKVGTCHLPRSCVFCEEVSGLTVWTWNLGDICRRRVSNKLQQGDSTLFYGTKNIGNQYSDFYCKKKPKLLKAAEMNVVFGDSTFKKNEIT